MNIVPIRLLFYVDLNTSPIGQIYMVNLDLPIRRTFRSTPRIVIKVNMIFAHQNKFSIKNTFSPHKKKFTPKKHIFTRKHLFTKKPFSQKNTFFTKKHNFTKKKISPTYTFFYPEICFLPKTDFHQKQIS